MLCHRLTELHTGRLQLPTEFLSDLLLLLDQRLFPPDQVGLRLARFLVLPLVLQEQVQRGGEVRLLGLRQRQALLHPQFLQFQQLRHRLLQILRTVSDDPARFFLILDLPRQLGELFLQVLLLFPQFRSDVSRLKAGKVRPRHRLDVLDNKSQEPVKENAQRHGKEPNGQSMDPHTFGPRFPLHEQAPDQSALEPTQILA